VAHYLTIPGVTDAEDIVAFTRGSKDHSFDIIINAGATAVWLFHAASAGTVIPLAVIAADSMMIALDDVVVSAASAASSPEDTQMAFALDAGAVRFV
jgi:hypothetical protein